MNFTTVVLERDDGVATVTLSRCEVKNALTPVMADELTGLFGALRRDDAVRAVVLTGAGGDFCAGGDVKVMAQEGPRSAEQRRAGMLRYRELTTTVLSLSKPLVAALDGVAYGAGLSLALMADIVLVSSRVRLAMVFHRIGLVPDLGAWYTLPRVVGLQRAKELVFSAREFGAAEAKQMGLALEVLAPEALMPRAMEIAHGFEGASAIALSLSKQALQASLQSELTAMLDFEAAAQAIAGGSDYVGEAVRRFNAKRPAQFRWPVRSND